MFKSSMRKYLLAFALGCLLFLALFAIFNLEPFQRRYFLTGDMFHQYYIFHNWFGEVLRTGQFDAVLYDWTAGLGNTMIGTMMYYLSSPFSLLTLFFNKESMPLGMTLILTLKIGSITTAFYWFLTKLTGKHLLRSYVFALCYAFSGFTMTYLMNLMWLDQLIFLPILVWYTLEWVHHRRWFPLFITLVLSFLTNFYTAYMVGVFLVFIVLIEFFKTHSRQDWRQALVLLLQLAGTALLVFCLLGIVLIPTLLELLSGETSLFSFNFEMIYSPLDLLSTLSVGFYDGVRTHHLPPLYIGLLPLIYAISFFFQPALSKKERLLHLSLYLFLFLSFSINPLYNLWHGFKSPIWFSGRHAFIFSFYSLYLAFRSFQLNHSGAVRKGLISVFTILFISTLMVLPSLTSLHQLFNDHLSLMISWGCLLGYTVVTLLMFHPKKLAVPRCLLYITLLEGAIGAGFILGAFLQDLTVVNTDTVNLLIEEEQNMIQALEASEQEFSSNDLFTRYNLGNLLINEGLFSNYPTLYSFNTFNHFNTTTVLNRLTYMSSKTGSAFYFGSFYPILNSLLGTSYLYETESLTEFYEPTSSSNLYFNPYVLPLAFKANPDILTVDLSHQTGTAAQDLVLNGLLGQLDEPTRFNYELEHTIYGSDNLEWNDDLGVYQLIDSTQSGTIQYHSYPITDTPIYLIFALPLQNQEDLIIELNGTPLTDIGLINFRPLSSENIQLTITCQANTMCGIPPVILYQIDETAIQSALTKLQETPLVLTEHDNRFISGTIRMDEPGVLFTSIPYSSGWTVKVDGETVDTLPLLHAAFLGIELSAGEHIIEFSYTPPGLKVGLVLSMLAFNGLLLARVFAFLRK